MGRALKYTLLAFLAIALLPPAIVYGLYFYADRQIPADWQPTRATYPGHVRMALWRSLGGSGAPRAHPMTPPGYAWALFSTTQVRVSPEEMLAYRTARLARTPAGQANAHAMHAAATIRASHWPVASQLDTVLDNTYLGDGLRGYRQGALHYFGLPIERLDAAQLHLLMVLEFGPGYLDPWCHRDRLRERALATAKRWRLGMTPAAIDVALASISAMPDHCH